MNVHCAGSVQDPSEGQSTLARLFANGTAENRAATEAKAASGSAPKLLADAQARKNSLLPAWPPYPSREVLLASALVQALRTVPAAAYWEA